MASVLKAVRRRGFIKAALAAGSGMLSVAGAARAQQDRPSTGGLPRNTPASQLFGPQAGELLTPNAKKLTKANLLEMQEIHKANPRLTSQQVVEEFNKDNNTAYTVQDIQSVWKAFSAYVNEQAARPSTAAANASCCCCCTPGCCCTASVVIEPRRVA